MLFSQQNWPRPLLVSENLLQSEQFCSSFTKGLKDSADNLDVWVHEALAALRGAPHLEARTACWVSISFLGQDSVVESDFWVH